MYKIHLVPGQRPTIYPVCAHKSKAIGKIQVIEYYSKPFDLSDDIWFEGFDGDQKC